MFRKDGTIDVETSLSMIKMARRQETPKTFIVESELQILYAIGEFPADLFYECPVHADVLLVEGYCEECEQVWENFEANRRKYSFIRLIVQRGFVLLTQLIEKKIDELAKMSPKIWIEFAQLEEEENLPRLKRRISKSKQGDPFYVIHKTL